MPITSHRVPLFVAHLALGKHGLDPGPSLTLRSITEQVHDDGTLANGLVDVEKVLARDPAILLRLLPAGAVLPHTNNDIEAVVTEVEPLTVALGAVTDESEGVVLEVVEELLPGPVGALWKMKLSAATQCSLRCRSLKQVRPPLSPTPS